MTRRSAGSIAPEQWTEFQHVAVADIKPSPLNPRRAPDAETLAELVESICVHGVLQPVLVRPGTNGSRFELIAGHRRLAAARLAGVETLPAIVRKLDDREVLEVQLVENLQRADLHPLEEASGYQQLMRVAKMDAAAVAARVGRSVKYVYDRVKLLDLTKEAKAAFLEGRMTAGHAILLARLKPADQTLAMHPQKGGLWEHEELLWDPGSAEEPLKDPVKPRSVRELQGWIDQHVRFAPQAADPMLFPATALAVEKAGATIVPITYEHYVHPDARDKSRIYGPRSWKRADGELVEDERTGRRVKSRTCERSQLGVIVVGPGRGDAFKVCVSKACATHWPRELKKAATRAKAAAAGGNAEERAKAEEAARVEQERRAEEKRDRWVRARMAVLRAIGERILKASAAADGPLAGYMLDSLAGLRAYGMVKCDAVPRGRTAEDLVRHLAFIYVCREASAWDVVATLTKLGRRFGVDAAKIVDAEVAPAKPAKKARAKKGGRK